MSSRRQVIINVGSNWATLILATAVSFFLSPFVVRHLGSEAYGAWALLGSLVGYLGLIDLGVRGAVTKYVATMHAGGRHDDAGHVTSAGLLFFGAAAMVVVVAGSVLALLVDRLFEVPPGLIGPARLAVFLGAVTVAVSIVGGVFGGVIVALLRFDFSNGVEVAVTLVRAAATVFALERGGGLVALAVIQLVTAVARTAIYALGMRRFYPGLEIHFARAREFVPTVLSFGVTSSLIHVSSALINYSDSIVIGLFLPLQAVTYFAIASNLILQARGVVGGVSQILAPMAGSLEGRGEMARVGDTMLIGARLATLAILPIAAAFAFRGETFIGLWMGEEFAVPAGSALRLLAPGLWVFASFQVCTSVMMGINRHRGMIWAFAIEAATNLLLCVTLIGPLGLTGVALGILLPRLAISLGFGPWYARSVLDLPMSAYWWQALLRPALAVLPFAAACQAAEIWWHPAGLVSFFAQIAALLPLAAVGAWAIALDPPERAQVAAAFGRGWHSLRSRRSLGEEPR